MAGDHHHHPPKVNKPSNSNFRQQRLVAWQPIMSPPHVVACLILVACVFVPVGIAILFANKDALDVEIQYDNRNSCGFNAQSSGLFRYNNFSMGCNFTVSFTIPTTMPAPVYMYYKLTNFYQNHRRFAKSRNDFQLVGQEVTKSSATDCAPFLTPGDNNNLAGTRMTVNGQSTTYGDMIYSPCGLVAWSMFNDTFALYRSTSATTQTLICNGSNFDKATNNPLSVGSRCHKKGITWASDYDKYKTPYFSNDVWSADRRYYNMTPLTTTNAYLLYGWYAGEAGHEVPVTTDEDLMVWMRTASLPEFRKLYRIIDVDLPAGTYYMQINEFFPVASFGGTKSFALSTVSWLGGKNEFLGIAYIVVGSLSFLLAAIFFVIYRVNSGRMQASIDSLAELQ